MARQRAAVLWNPAIRFFVWAAHIIFGSVLRFTPFSTRAALLTLPFTSVGFMVLPAQRHVAGISSLDSWSHWLARARHSEIVSPLPVF